MTMSKSLRRNDNMVLGLKEKRKNQNHLLGLQQFINGVQQTQTADWQVNGVNIVVKCPNRFHTAKI